MGVLTDDLRAFLDAHPVGVLATVVIQRMTAAAEPPDPPTDEELATAGRVVLAITIERVSAANYITAASETAGASG